MLSDIGHVMQEEEIWAYRPPRIGLIPAAFLGSETGHTIMISVLGSTYETGQHRTLVASDMCTDIRVVTETRSLALDDPDLSSPLSGSERVHHVERWASTTRTPCRARVSALGGAERYVILHPRSSWPG